MELELIIRAVHQIFASVWVGATLYMTVAVLPAARDGVGEPATYERLSSRFTVVSIASVVVLFVTGGHLAGTLYTSDSLLGTTSGNLVLAMLALWFVLAGVLHVGTGRLTGGLDDDRLREPARDALRWYAVASVLGVALLVNAVAFRFY